MLAAARRVTWPEPRIRTVPVLWFGSLASRRDRPCLEVSKTNNVGQRKMERISGRVYRCRPVVDVVTSRASTHSPWTSTKRLCFLFAVIIDQNSNVQ